MCGNRHGQRGQHGARAVGAWHELAEGEDGVEAGFEGAGEGVGDRGREEIVWWEVCGADLDGRVGGLAVDGVGADGAGAACGAAAGWGWWWCGVGSVGGVGGGAVGAGGAAVEGGV